MQGCQEEIADEVDKVTLADACAHPRTVMVLGLNADTARSAMESSWRSENVASGAQGQLESQMLWIDDLG